MATGLREGVFRNNSSFNVLQKSSLYLGGLARFYGGTGGKFGQKG